MNPLTIALSKGRISKEIMALLKAQKITFSRSVDRQLYVDCPQLNARIYFMKAADICMYVNQGQVALGILGNDVIDNEPFDLYEIASLPIGKCKMCLAGPKGFDPLKQKPLNIATKYPTLAKDYLKKNSLQGQVYKLNGSVELGPQLGLAPVILDIVETGTTLRDNGLEILTELFEVSAKVISNKVAYKVYKKEITTFLEALLSAPVAKGDPEVSLEKKVRQILQEIKQDKDRALFNAICKWDRYDPSLGLMVTEEDIAFAKTQVSKAYMNLLKSASDNIRAYHELQKPQAFALEGEGFTLGQRMVPMDRAGVYIPGGTATYPSSVLMNVIPAQIAGVEEIAIASPPDAQGQINPYVLVALDYLGVKEIYKMGGAQAIAALAYGTESVKKVNIIVGPGNQFVAEAKKQVFGQVAIDMIAGPSEILILADQKASPQYIAADLLSQLEHDPLARGTLITTDLALIEKVKSEIALQAETLSRKGILQKSLYNLQYEWANSLDKAIALANAIAPEHLQLMIEDPFESLDKIKNAGSIFLGHYTPEALGDYFAGPNHTLPTGGTAKFSSPLGVYDFIKRPSYIYYSKEKLKTSRHKITTFAHLEGLDGHANAICQRFQTERRCS